MSDLASSFLATAKAAIKRSPACYRCALWLYFRLFNIRTAITRTVYSALLNASTAFPVWRERPPALLLQVMCWHTPQQLAWLSADLYQRGDEAFHRGSLRCAFSRWNASAEVQKIARARCNAPWSSDVLVLTSLYWTKLVGHMALLDALLKLMCCDRLHARRSVLFVRDREVANPYLLELVSRLVAVEPMPEASSHRQERIAIYQQKLNVIETKAGKRFIYQACYEAEAAWQGRLPLFAFPQRDAVQCKATLAQLGLQPDDWFVTLHARGPRYWQEPHKSTRNASLGGYVRAIAEIVRRGGRVVWLGEEGTGLGRDLDKYLINYADSRLRSPMLDIYLCAACRFFIGTSSGISHVPGIFGVPVLFTNVSPPFSRPWRKGDLWVPKTLVDVRTQRPVPFLDTLRPPLALLDTEEKLRKSGLRTADCDPDDLAAAVREMFEQLDGTSAYRERENEVQEAVNARFANMHTRSFARLAREFSLRHTGLSEFHTL